MDRREFLRAAGATGLVLSSPMANAHAAWGAKLAPRRVGLIGSGWYGKADLLRLIQVEPVEVVSLCDVDKVMLAEAGDLVASRQKSKKTPRLYGDYRKMLAEKDLDIVLIATPDHWHALAAIAAMEAGADLYCQKPISVDVAEGQAMLAAARKLKRVVQVGTQRRSTPHLIDAKEKVIEAGLLGKIGLVEICCYYHMRGRGNPPEMAPPASLDWESWIGPAPFRPYNTMIHPRGWRSFKEFGNGIVGDMCIHMLDMTRWMMGLGWPTTIASSGGILVDKQSIANIPDTQEATFDYGDTKVVWTHRTWGSSPDPKYPWAATFYGDKGTLKASVNGYEFTPMDGRGKKLSADVKMELDEYPEDKTEKDLERHVAPAIRKHMRDFLAAIDSRGKPVADIEQGYISTASCILANVSQELGRSVAWDAEAGKIARDDEANKKLARPYRDPWVHP